MLISHNIDSALSIFAGAEGFALKLSKTRKNSQKILFAFLVHEKKIPRPLPPPPSSEENPAGAHDPTVLQLRKQTFSEPIVFVSICKMSTKKCLVQLRQSRKVNTA